MKFVSGVALACFASVAQAQPFHDTVPAEFQGTFASTPADCKDPDGVNLIEIAADGIHYYEGDDYLIIGVKFEGASTKSGRFVPLFNGRFTGRSETQLLGEVNARMEMETPDTLLRYPLKDGDVVNPKPVNTWIRCPKKTP